MAATRPFRPYTPSLDIPYSCHSFTFTADTAYSDTFAVASADGTMTSVTTNILGTNDAAVLSSDTKNLTEGATAATISTSGALTISDVDSSATFLAQTGAAVPWRRRWWRGQARFPPFAGPGPDAMRGALAQPTLTRSR